MVVIIKKIAGILRVEYYWTPAYVMRMLGLTTNEYKNAIKDYKQGKYEDIYVDRRGMHVAINHRRQQSLLEAFTLLLELGKFSSLNDVRNQFLLDSQDSQLSYSSVRRIVKYDLGYKYKCAYPIKAAKNNDKNMIYRRYVSKQIVKALSDDDILISIDESNFSGIPKKSRVWINTSATYFSNPILSHCSKSLWLLLAISKYKVEALAIVEGPINQIHFVDFITRLTIRLRDDEATKEKKIMYLLDNLFAHKTPLVKAIVIKYNISILFTAP